MKNQSFICFLTLILFIGLTGCCSYRLEYCPPDQRPVNFPKNQRCAKIYYKDAVRNIGITLKATTDAIKNATSNAEVGIQNKAEPLAEKFDQETSRLKQKLLASFLSFSIDPCGTGESHFKLMAAINDKDIELQKVKIQFENAQSKAELEKASNYEYLRGKEDGKNMGTLAKFLKEYYVDNQKFPTTLGELNKEDLIKKIAKSRLDYSVESDHKIILRFAGEDYALDTDDDRVYLGLYGEITNTSQILTN